MFAPHAFAENAPPPATAVIHDGMIRVPGGRFTMGSSQRESPPNERPPRVVTVGSFWMDRTEVTVSAYRACVDKGSCLRPPKTSTQCTYDLGDPLLPVSCVPWSSAQTYCAAVGKRLPREVEWEFAARGSSSVLYPWGNANAECNLAVTLVSDDSQESCGGAHPSRVGMHPAGKSPFGALDMSGNVEEWVSDDYAENASDLSLHAGASHVLRGGGWLTAPALARVTSRNWGSSREAGPNVGLRCAQSD
ncbi:MAG: formylglycine-generating enzyme family protein [Polyangiaceae bacterium]|nr:formylglycine-generating enzyme family protein [Polyangiaceae bacterium]